MLSMGCDKAHFGAQRAQMACLSSTHAKHWHILTHRGHKDMPFFRTARTEHTQGPGPLIHKWIRHTRAGLEHSGVKRVQDLGPGPGFRSSKGHLKARLGAKMPPSPADALRRHAWDQSLEWLGFCCHSNFLFQFSAAQRFTS